MARLLLINGPNLSLLGQRQPEIYGQATLEDIVSQLGHQAQERGHALACFQNDAEHELVKRIHAAREEGIEFILFNPAAFTHTSVAIRDALSGVAIPFIELHLSNVHAREEFRKHSYFSDIAQGVISGLGALGYELALRAAIEYVTNTK